ncbi:restriction endonuclease subunit S [Paenibacillus sp. N1-5-1-14]|nr:restriction endonuclease subunit S [Paenibacillus radicibacter]
MGLLNHTIDKAIVHIPTLIHSTEHAATRLIQASNELSSITQYLRSIEDQTETDSIPDHWRMAAWGEVGTFHHGSAFPHAYQNNSQEAISFYKVGSLREVGSDGHLPRAKDTISEESRIGLRAALVPANAIVFAKIGEAIKLNRRALLQHPACIDNNLIAFSCQSTIVHHRYVYYWSQAVNFYELTQASAVPSIRKMSLANLPIPLPPIEEQLVIIRQLESLLGLVYRAFQAIDEANGLFTARSQARNQVYPSGMLSEQIIRLALQGKLSQAFEVRR